MDVVHRSCPAHHLDTRDSQCHGVSQGKGSSLASIRTAESLGGCKYLLTDMGSAFDMVEHLVQRCVGRYDYT